MPAGKRKRRTQEERSSLSHRRMVSAAISLIVESGIPGTTLAAIGERAGYSRGLVSHRYRTKSGLLAQVHDTAVADWMAMVDSHVAERSGIDALLGVVEALASFLTEAPDELRAMYMLRYASIDPGAEYRAQVIRAHRAQRRDAQKWIEQGQKAGTIRGDLKSPVLAELFCALCDGLVYRALVAPDVAVRDVRALLKTRLRDWLAAA